MSDEYSIDTKYKLGTISTAEYERKLERLGSLQTLAESEDALRKQKLNRKPNELKRAKESLA